MCEKTYFGLPTTTNQLLRPLTTLMRSKMRLELKLELKSKQMREVKVQIEKGNKIPNRKEKGLQSLIFFVIHTTSKGF